MISLTLSWVTGGAFGKDSRYLLQETADTYDPAGRVTQLTDARAKVTRYAYGGNPNNAFLTQVTRVHDGTGPVDLVTTISYDGNGYVSSIQDEGGAVKHFIYDTYGRLSRVTNTASDTVKAYGYAYSRTSGNGWTFDPANPNAVAETTFLQASPAVSVVSTQYLDGLGRGIQAVVPTGTDYLVTATQYDAMGRPWRQWKPYTRPSGGYDPNFATNATGFYNSYHGTGSANPYSETLYTADALARVRRVNAEYLGSSPTDSVRYAYGTDPGTLRQYTTVTDEVGKQTRSHFDFFGNQVQTRLGYGAPEVTTTTFTYNVLGQRTQVTDPRNLLTTYTLDTRGLVTAKTSPDAGTVGYKYDQAGNLRYRQDPYELILGKVFFTTYDFANRPLISGLGYATFSTLDPFISNAVETGNSNWFILRQYDTAPARVFPWYHVPAPPPLSNVTGRLAAVASKSNTAWQVTYYSYDVDGRVAARYTYTQVLSTVPTTISYTRDLRDAVTQRALTVGASTWYQWYDYDGRGLLWKVYGSTGPTKPGSPDLTLTYRPSGQVASRQFAGGPLVPLTYSIRERLDSIGNPALTSYPFAARYSYFANGTVNEAEFYSAGSPVAPRYKYVFGSSSYDALNRLKGADYFPWSGSWVPSSAYQLSNLTYDAAGNLLTLRRNWEDGALIDNLTYSYTAGTNRLNRVTDGVSSAETWDVETGIFSYLANGTMWRAPAPYAMGSAAFDFQTLPVTVFAQGVATNYRYNEAGQRIVKWVGTGNQELYVLEEATQLGVVTVDGSGNVVSAYWNLVAGDKVLGRQPNTGNRLYYHTDLLGSTRAVVDASTQQVVESYDYDPWGVLMPGRTLAGTTKEGFTGKERDPSTGLDYFGARYNMAALGRWAAVDPLGEKHPEWTPYNYVLNNPPALIDPDGKQVPANDPARLLPTLTPSRPWVPGEVGTRALVGAAATPESRDLAVGLTPCSARCRMQRRSSRAGISLRASGLVRVVG